MSRETVFMMENIMGADGDVTRYGALARKNRHAYRTLNEFFAEKLKGSTKQKLAEKLGVYDNTINNWEKKGIPGMKQAMLIAVALELDLEETNFFLRKYAGMGTLYPADRLHAKYIYTLLYRAELEHSFPYLPGETTKSWIDRVWDAMDVATCQPDNEGKDSREGQRPATEIFMEALMSRDVEALKSLSFRSAGDKACVYLEDFVKGGPFEKYYGNRSHVDASSGESVRNTRALSDRYHEEERDRYNNLIYKLKKGGGVRRDEIIEIAMLLRMTREQADTLLEKCGENPINARNLYEGALLMVWSFLSELCPDWFAKAAAADQSRYDAMEEFILREYGEELESGGPLDMQLLFSRQVERALSPPPKVLKTQLRELPGWYLSGAQREKRMEKRRFSAILSECAEQLCLVWRRAEEEGAENIQWSLKTAVSEMLEDYGFKSLDGAVDAMLLRELDALERDWTETVREGAGLALDAESVERYCLKKLERLDTYYIEKYAPKKRKGGAGGGDKPIE